MAEIKAVLFDMDGVLIDAKDWHYEALNEALALFGVEISRYDHLHTFDGLPTRVKLEMLSEQYYLPSELHGFINEIKQKKTMEYISRNCHPTFIHEYALSRLRKEGYKIAVCSNSMRKSIDQMMKCAALSDYIDLIVSNEDVTRSKPDPEMYDYAIRKFALEPRDCLVVEDNPKGVQAGLASGAHVLKVENTTDVTYANIMRKIAEVENDQYTDSCHG